MADMKQDEQTFEDLLVRPMLDPEVIPDQKTGLTALQLLEEARAQIAKPGKWIKGQEILNWPDCENDEVCMVGALRWAANKHYDKSKDYTPHGFSMILGLELHSNGDEVGGTTPFDHPVRQATALATRFLGEAVIQLHPQTKAVKAYRRDPNDAPVPQDGICNLPYRVEMRAIRQNGNPARAKQVHENMHDMRVIVSYNDESAVSQEAVVQVFDRAIEMAKAA